MQATPESPTVRVPRAAWPVRYLTHLVRWLRVSAFVSVALALVLLFNLHQARGQLGERLLSFGRELGPLRDLLHGTQSARLNGENMFLATTITDQPVAQVLDRFEQHCLEHTGGLREAFEALPAAARDQVSRKSPAAWRLRNGILREDASADGMVVCIARPGQAGIKAWIADAQRFFADGELAHLGELRYAYAERTESGRTRVLTTFTQGTFNLYRALGERPATSGTQLEAVPLPPRAERPMTFRVDGMPYAAQLLQVPGTPEQVTQYYLTELPRHGWKRVLGPGEIFSNMVLTREGKTLTVAAFELDDSGSTRVALTEGAAK